VSKKTKEMLILLAVTFITVPLMLFMGMMIIFPVIWLG